MLTDLRQAARALRAAPALSFVAALTLALGIGASTAAYSVVDAVLLRPLPYERPDRLLYVWEQGKTYANETAQSSLHNAYDWRRQTRAFAHLSAYRYWIFNLVGGPQAEGLLGAYVTDDAFTTLGVRPALGRAFRPGEDRPGANHVAILSDDLWRRRFHADSGVVGRTLRMDGGTYTVVGVMPRGFDFPETLPANAALPSRRLDIWVPTGVDPESEGRGDHNWWVFGRLADGASVAQARDELARFGRAQHAAHVEADEQVLARELREHVVKPVRPALLLFAAAVCVVLLVACANVASLLLARGTTRGRELGVRLALGASSWRLARQLLAESFVLATIGALGGVALASLGVRALVAIAPPSLPRVGHASVDGTVVVFAILAATLAALAAGLLPALHATRTAPAGAMRTQSRGGTVDHRVQRTRGALVVGEIALSLVLLSGAGLLVRSYAALSNVTLGFRTDRLLTMIMLLPPQKYGDTAARNAFYERAVERVAALPGVEGAAMINTLPLSGLGSNSTGYVEGRPVPAPQDRPTLLMRDVTPDYHRVLGIRLRAGRLLTVADSAGAPPVAVVSQALVDKLLPHEDPIGKRLKGMRAATFTIVGVVDDIRDDALDLAPQPTVYLAMPQDADFLGCLAVRTRGDPRAIEMAVRRELAAIDPEQPVMNVRTMGDYVAQAVETRRFSLFLTGVFAVTALVLATVGLYGVLSYLVGQRTREIGVRVALGARRADVARLVLDGAVRLALGGIVLGIPAALLAGRLLRAQLYGVTPGDPLTLVGVAVVLALTAAGAALVPARRAARVDPMVALRSE